MPLRSRKLRGARRTGGGRPGRDLGV